MHDARRRWPFICGAVAVAVPGTSLNALQLEVGGGSPISPRTTVLVRNTIVKS